MIYLRRLHKPRLTLRCSVALPNLAYLAFVILVVEKDTVFSRSRFAIPNDDSTHCLEAISECLANRWYKLSGTACIGVWTTNCDMTVSFISCEGSTDFSPNFDTRVVKMTSGSAAEQLVIEFKFTSYSAHTITSGRQQ